jgi:putative endonuclease
LETGPNVVPNGQPSFAKATEWHAMYYSYILLSSKSHIFYFGSTKDLTKRIDLHNGGKVRFTKSHLPWKLVWYGSFETERQARDFELYLKSGSGKAFAYKRLISVALEKDFKNGRRSSTKL